ncbi:MAG: DUF4367 domain-containing protein [Oscillospiraceae bacterium]|nr:DUF4367 domain-containing protein [Oscillospiraceae bacterium]
MKEMRLMQIIGDIDEKYIDEAAPAEQKKKAMRFTPWVRYASIAACAMLVIGVGIFAITQHSGNIIDTPAQSEEADSSDFVQSGNPYAEYDTLEEAENTVGFAISVPDSYGRYTEPYYAVIEGKILEVQYYNGDDRGMIISKSRGSEDISGDFNEYNTVTETEVNGNTVTIKGNGDEFSLALWVSGDYSYSVSVSSGISENALKEIIEKIK